MFVSTPERSHSIDRIQKHANSGTFLLPPLLAMLREDYSSPTRPTLPALNSFSTPKTPRFVLPSIRSTSTPALATLPEFTATPPVSATARIMNAVQVSGEHNTVKRESVSHPFNSSNVSVDSDADVSVNNSMVMRPKRKHSATLPTRDFAFISHSPATYPSQEPAIDNASLARRKRRRTSPVELAVLNEQFKLGLTPDKARRTEIAEKVNMTEKAVQIWFQNKRQSLRRMKHSEKEVTLLPPTPDTSALVAAGLDQVPLHASTPLKPALVKSESQQFPRSPAMAQLSPIRSLSASNLRTLPVQMSLQTPLRTSSQPSQASTRLFSDCFQTSLEKQTPELVMNLTNKKQPEFARQLAQASTQVMTFKLTPKGRKPLGVVNSNTLNKAKPPSSKDSQCIQSLLSLKVGHR